MTIMTTPIPAERFFWASRETAQYRRVPADRNTLSHGLGNPQAFPYARQFCFVLEGGFSEVYESRSRTCSPSSVVFHPAGEVHSDRHEPVETRMLCVEVEQHRLETVRECSSILDTSADFQGGPVAHLAARLYREFQCDDALASLAIEGLVLEITAAAARSVSVRNHTPPYWLRQARELVRDEFAGALTLSGIAAAISVHPVHLAREFRRCYACTVADAVRQRRIDVACQRLAQTQDSLGEVALSVGFADQSHFTRFLSDWLASLLPNTKDCGARASSGLKCCA